MAIIGLVGRARSGKTTIAEHWKTRYGFKIISLADTLKDIVEAALKTCPPPEHEKADWNELLRVNRTPFTRWLLQFIGTDIVRDRIDKEFWIRDAVARITAAQMQDKTVVIPDVRFKNEADAIVALGGIMVRIKRSGVAVEYGASHSSETEGDSIEARKIIDNNGTLDELFKRADETIFYAESIH